MRCLRVRLALAFAGADDLAVKLDGIGADRIKAGTNQPSRGFLVPDRFADNPGLGCEMAPDSRTLVPVPGRPLVTVLVHDPALPDDRERLDTAAATQLRPSTCAGSRPARRHAGLTTTQRKPPRPVSLTLINRAPWRTQLHAYSEHRIRRYAPGATPILSCECQLYNRSEWFGYAPATALTAGEVGNVVPRVERRRSCHG